MKSRNYSSALYTKHYDKSKDDSQSPNAIPLDDAVVRSVITGINELEFSGLGGGL